MILESIQLENIRSHAKTVVPFIRGFNCLVGGLGQGKSSVLHAFDFVLFGDPLGRSYEYLLREDAEMILLVRPQFEVGKGEVGTGGIVREKEKRLKAVHRVKDHLEHTGLKTIGVFKSPVLGHKGNSEYFLYMRRG